MGSVFTPRLDILPAPQRQLWDEFGALPADFVLYGGTAIALHLGHRQSIDFDFFSTESFDPGRLAHPIPFLADATIIQSEPDTLGVLVDRGGSVKLSFFGLSRLARVLSPHVAPDNGLRVASLLDLAGTKVEVVQRRAEAKDYVHIDAILLDGRVDLPLALASAMAIHGKKFNPQITLKALSYFDDGSLQTLPNDMKDRLAKAAREVDLDQLPSLRGQDMD